MRPLPGLHTSSEAPASLSPTSPSIEVDAVASDAQHAHALWLSSSSAESSSAESSSAESSSGSESGAEKRAGEASILQMHPKECHPTDMEASVPTPATVVPSRQPAVLRRGEFAAVLTKRLARLAATRAAEAEDNSCVNRSPQPAWDSRPAKPRQKMEAEEMAEMREMIALPSKEGGGGQHSKDVTDPSQTSQASSGSGEGGRPRWDKRPLMNPPGAVSGFRPVAQEVQKYFSLHRQTERSTQQGSSAASSLSPSSSLLESNSEDDSSVQPSHQTSPVRQTERGTAVAAVQFLKLLNALDPSTGNLTTEQLTNGVTPRAARATPEYLRSRIPARPEAAPAEPAAPAKPEPKRDPPRRMSAEQHSAHTIEMDQHSAHTTEMLLLHHMRQAHGQADNNRYRTTSGELRAAWNSPVWSRGAGRSRAKTLDSLC